tara:strand:+ start:3696 stop:4124 length:429 start_codon:yes stop_codon:yes gene_type:complete
MAKINFDISKRLDITVKRGDSFKLELTLKDSSDNPLNLHGDTFHFAVAAENGIRMGTNTVVPPPTIVTDQILTDDESTTAETATGKVRFEASAADLKFNLPAGTHRYDIQYVDASDTIDGEGNARTILFGNFIVKDDFSILL